mgnify:CR=1 FL=1
MKLKTTRFALAFTVVLGFGAACGSKEDATTPQSGNTSAAPAQRNNSSSSADYVVPISRSPVVKPMSDSWSTKTAAQKHDIYLNWLFIYREGTPNKKKEVVNAIQSAGLSEEDRAELEKQRIHFGIPELR